MASERTAACCDDSLANAELLFSLRTWCLCFCGLPSFLIPQIPASMGNDEYEALSPRHHHYTFGWGALSLLISRLLAIFM